MIFIVSKAFQVISLLIFISTSVFAQGLPLSIIPPQPQNVRASDGRKSISGVVISWQKQPGVRSHRVYRSEYSGELGSLLAEVPLFNQFLDRRAIPGVRYFYSVSSAGDLRESEPSAQDEGFRVVPSGLPIDQDGDGISDAQENIDGTNPKERGSVRLHLPSPAFTTFDRSQGTLNFLELISRGRQPSDIFVTVFDSRGKVMGKNDLTISGLNQFHVDINEITSRRGGNKSTVTQRGIVRIDLQERSGSSLSGQLSRYKMNANRSGFDYAYAKPFRPPLHGTSYTVINSLDPAGLGLAVTNRAEIVNLSTRSQSFSIKLWGQGGSLQKSLTIHLGKLSSGTFDLTRGLAAGAYLAQFEPFDGAIDYLASVTREQKTSVALKNTSKSNFAFALDAQPGDSDPRYVPLVNKVGRCWSQTAWLETANIREKAITMSIVFRAQDGQTIAKTTIALGPKSQYHFNTNTILPTGTVGTAEILASDPGALLAHNIVYFHNCGENAVKTAYASPARVVRQNPLPIDTSAVAYTLTGNYNRFFGMKNTLLVSSVADYTVQFDVSTNAQLLVGQLLSGRANQMQEIDLNELSSPDSYGLLGLNLTQGGAIVAEALRMRETSDGKIDFVMEQPLE